MSDKDFDTLQAELDAFSRRLKAKIQEFHDRGTFSDTHEAFVTRILQDSEAPAAIAAVDYFVHAMTKYAGAYAAVLGGLDAFVFTAGIREHSVPVRAALCRQLVSLGVTLDDQANASGGPRISTPDSPVSVWVIPTNEELMIAQYTLALVRPSPI